MTATELEITETEQPSGSSAGAARSSSGPATTSTRRTSWPRRPDIDLHRAIDCSSSRAARPSSRLDPALARFAPAAEARACKRRFLLGRIVVP